MANMGNLSYQLSQQIQETAPALNTTAVQPIFTNADGMILGVTNITAVAGITALTGAADMFAPGCMLIVANADAAASVYVLINTGTKASPTFTGLVS